MSGGLTDRFDAARAVADAVLYEGYVLYPYRASSRKNQQRFQFGVLMPRAFSETDGSERSAMRTECLLEADLGSLLAVRIRCLHLQRRAIYAPLARTGPGTAGDGFGPVEALVVDGQRYVAWDEAVEQVVDVTPLLISSTASAGQEEHFVFVGGTETEVIRRADGAIAGKILRRREQVCGRVLVATKRLRNARDDGRRPRFKVTVDVENTTAWHGGPTRRDDVIGHGLVAVHTMCSIDEGSFVSLLEPPDDAREAATDCTSDGTFPVLIGGDDVVLSSPIILYDHPEIAPESPGDLYDATEIDEILALRVLTLTEEEKSEARGTDPRAARIIDRCDELTPELWERLHGGVRPIGPPAGNAASCSDAPEQRAIGPKDEPPSISWWLPEVDATADPWSDAVVIAGVKVTKGSAVRLWPSHRADAQDLFLRGLSATVAGVFTDVDGTEHVAVTIDDDPATEELEWQGRYLFFFPDEVEPTSGSEQLR